MIKVNDDRSYWWTAIILIVQSIWMLWLVGPIFHGMIMTFYLRPALFELLILSIVIAVTVYFIFKYIKLIPVRS